MTTIDLPKNIAATDPPEKEPETSPTEPQDADIVTMMEEIISEAVQGIKQPFKFADKSEKLKAIKLMLDRGPFLIKGGVDFAAQRLKVSRYSIYNYLKEVKYL